MPGKRSFVIVGIAAVILQASLLAWIAIVQVRTFALAVDFSIYQHAFVEITRGVWNPDATYVGGVFFQNHGEAIMWPIAILLRWFDPAGALLAVQLFAAVGVSLLTMWWIGSVVDRSPQGWDRTNTIAASICVAVAVLNPWIVWSNAQDFHFEIVASFFLLACLMAFVRGRIAWGLLAAFGCVLCGDVSTTYLAGVVVYLLIAGGPRNRYAALGIAVASIGWLAFLHSLAVQRGASLPSLYGHLAPHDPHATDSILRLAITVLTHPFAALHALGMQALNIYANLSPGGIIGIFTGWGLALGAIPLLENNLTQGQLFSQPSFQSLPIYTGLSMGTIAVLLWLRRRLSPAIVTALAILIAVNASAWFFTIIPSVKGRWLIVGPGAARVLSDAYYGTSHSTQIVSSQGVLGRFGAFALSNFFVRGIALRSEPLTILFTPYDGINTLDVNADFANLASLVRQGARIVESDRGAWWLQFDAPLGDPHLALPFESAIVEAWVIQPDQAVPVTVGKQNDWHLTGTGKPGYVLDRDYWRYPLGAYEAHLEMSNTAQVTLEILNASNRSLIFRRTIEAGPRRTLDIPFDHTVHVEEEIFRGFGPFRFNPLPPRSNNALELRVWSDGHAKVDVYKAGIIPLPRRNLFR